MGHTEHRSFNDSLLVFPPVFSRIGSFSALEAFDITVSLVITPLACFSSSMTLSMRYNTSIIYSVTE